MKDYRSCVMFPSASRPPSSLSEGCFQAAGWRWNVAKSFAARLASNSSIAGICTPAPSGKCLCALSTGNGNSISIAILLDFFSILLRASIPCELMYDFTISSSLVAGWDVGELAPIANNSISMDGWMCHGRKGCCWFCH